VTTTCFHAARLVRTLAIVLALGLCAGIPLRAPAADPPIEIDAILSLTGPAAFLGQSEAEALQTAEELINRNGGVKGRPVHFAIGDDQTNPQVALQLANALIAKKVPVILGPSIAASTNALAPLVAKGGPVVYCFTPAIRPVPGGFVFSSTVTSTLTTGIGVRYFRERGWKRMALLAPIDATGQDLEQSIDFAFTLPENRSAQLVAREHFSPADLNIAAQVARIKAANPQALLTAATGAPFGTLVHALSDAGLNIPVYAPSSNMTQTAMTQYASFLPSDLFFSTLIGQMPGVVGKGPIHDAQTVFFNALRARNLKPNTGHIVSWDPVMLVVDAYRKFGAGMTAEQLHGYLEGLHGRSGINGVYDFRDGGQRGLFENAVVVFRWDPKRSDFVASSRPGGKLQ
jgi:branched-chain amino acid transport system substrate-binding protein